MNKKRLGILCIICLAIVLAGCTPRSCTSNNGKLNSKNVQVAAKGNILEEKKHTSEDKDIVHKENSEKKSSCQEKCYSKNNDNFKEELKIEKQLDSNSHEKLIDNKGTPEKKSIDKKVKEGTQKESNKVKKDSIKEDKVQVKNKIEKNKVKIEDKVQNNKAEIKDKIQIDNKISKEETKEKIPTFTLIVSKEQKGYMGEEIVVLENKQINIEENKNAMSYLKDNIKNVEDKGGFINNILGIKGKFPIPKGEITDEQKEKGILGIAWFIYLNGEKTKVGANDIHLEEGDILLFDYHQWDKREFKQ